MSDSEFLLVYIQGDCVSRGHTAIPQILFESVTIHLIVIILLSTPLRAFQG